MRDEADAPLWPRAAPRPRRKAETKVEPEAKHEAELEAKSASVELEAGPKARSGLGREILALLKQP